MLTQHRQNTRSIQAGNIQTIYPRAFLLGGDLEVNRIGYGALRLTAQPGNYGPYPDWEQGIDLLQTALRLGVNFSILPTRMDHFGLTKS